jgi:23S rRNA (cytosine1962-C5)-methyltransferase
MRLLHAEGDEMPGFIADAYGDTVVLQVLTLGAERILPALADGLRAAGYRFIYLKIKENTAWLEHISLKPGWYGPAGQDIVQVQEHGMRFMVNVVEGQKTGFFLDQRDARALLRTYSAGAKVLNMFSYTGGFSLAALAGGAVQAISVDISKPAVEQAHQNAVLNGWGEDKHQSVAADCFEYLRQAPPDLDIIVLDPPAFAKKESALKNASRGYKELNLKAFKHLKPGGLLFTFSCSQAVSRDLFRKIIFGAAADARRSVRILHQTTQPPDHPINIYHPEGEYLKGLVLQVE